MRDSREETVAVADFSPVSWIALSGTSGSVLDAI